MHSSTVETLVRRDQFVWSFGPDMTPVISVEPGDVVRLETNDCFHGQVRSELDLPDTIDSSLVNAATGPIEVRGAMPGDTLVVELLEVNRGRGARRWSPPARASSPTGACSPPRGCSTWPTVWCG